MPSKLESDLDLSVRHVSLQVSVFRRYTAVMDCYAVAKEYGHSGYRRRWYQVFRRYDKGDCSRSKCLYDGKYLCRM